MEQIAKTLMKGNLYIDPFHLEQKELNSLKFPIILSEDITIEDLKLSILSKKLPDYLEQRALNNLSKCQLNTIRIVIYESN